MAHYLLRYDHSWWTLYRVFWFMILVETILTYLLIGFIVEFHFLDFHCMCLTCSPHGVYAPFLVIILYIQ